QLRAAGEEVAALVMVASDAPMRRREPRVASGRPVKVPGGPPPGIGPRAIDPRGGPGGRDTTDEIARTIENLRKQAASLVGALSDQEAMNMARVFRNTRELVRRHQCREFDGDLLIFVTGEDKPELDRPRPDRARPAAHAGGATGGWRRLPRSARGDHEPRR